MGTHYAMVRYDGDARPLAKMNPRIVREANLIQAREQVIALLRGMVDRLDTDGGVLDKAGLEQVYRSTSAFADFLAKHLDAPGAVAASRRPTLVDGKAAARTMADMAWGHVKH